MALCKFASALRSALSVTRNLSTRGHATTLRESKERLRDLHVPEKPKKPLTPYFRFLADVRADLLRRQPDARVTDIVRQAAGDWAKVHATVKEKYVDAYKQDLQEYTAKMATYTAQLTPAQLETIREVQRLKTEHKKKRELKKKSKDLDKPKRPVGPYMQYLLEKAKASNHTMVELMQKLKGQFQQLPEAERRKYTELYEDDRKRYELQMAEWERRMLAEGHDDVVRQSSLRRKPSRLTAATSKPRKQ